MQEDINFITLVGYVKRPASTRNEGKANEITCFSITSDPYDEDSESSVFFVYVTDPTLKREAFQLEMGTKVFVTGEYHNRYAFMFETILHSQRIDAYSIDVVRMKVKHNG